MEGKEKITALQTQMKQLREDNSLLKGVTFNTVAGDIVISDHDIALTLVDCLIKDLQEQINYERA